MTARAISSYAGFTCAAIVASLPIPMWTAMRPMLSRPGGPSLYGWVAMTLSLLFAAVLPIFYFTLSRSGAAGELPRRERRLCIAGAIAGSIVIAAGIPVWLQVSGFGLTAVRMFLSDLATVACIWFLAVLVRYSPKHTVGIVEFPARGPLRAITRFTLAAGVIWFVFNLLGVLLIPFTYDRLLQTNRTEADLILGGIRTLLEQICLFTVPCVFYILQLRAGRLHL